MALGRGTPVPVQGSTRTDASIGVPGFSMAQTGQICDSAVATTRLTASRSTSGQRTMKASAIRVKTVGCSSRRQPCTSTDTSRAGTIPDPEGLHRALSLHIVHANRALFAQEVRFLRKYLGWSADHLSAVMGVDPKTISRWENGRQKLGPVAERFLRILVLQRLDQDAQASADQVLPTLENTTANPEEARRMAASRKGWKKAA